MCCRRPHREREFLTLLDGVCSIMLATGLIHHCLWQTAKIYAVPSRPVTFVPCAHTVCEDCLMPAEFSMNEDYGPSASLCPVCEHHRVRDRNAQARQRSG